MTTQSTGAAAVPGRLSRRRALSGLATVGVSLPLLSACSDGGGPSASTASDPTAATPEGSTDSPSSEPTTPTPTEEPSAESTPDSGGGVAATADVPVGGGVIVADSRVVVTQPTAGEFKCFSAVCTHNQCLVSEVGASIVCTCHNSSFDISTGEVLGGPAPAPLPAVDFTITKDQVVLS